MLSVTSDDAVWWNGGRVLTIALLCAITAVASSVLLGHDGVTNLLALRAERQRLGEQAVALIEQNSSLRDELKRLKSDDRFLESIARRELGLVRPDEVVYRFHRKAKPGATR
jgi:cell division protein FtsB